MRRPVALVSVATAFVLAATTLLAAPRTAPQYQRGKYTLEPTPLEALATAPDAMTTWSQFLGKLDGGNNFALMTAIAVQSTTAPDTKLRGVGIELRHDGPARDCWLKHVEWTVMCEREQAAVFIEEDRLDAVLAAIRRGNAEAHPGHGSGITTFGSSNGRWGVLFCGYELQGRSLDEVAAMLDAAALALKAAPR